VTRKPISQFSNWKSIKGGWRWQWKERAQQLQAPKAVEWKKRRARYQIGGNRSDAEEEIEVDGEPQLHCKQIEWYQCIPQRPHCGNEGASASREGRRMSG